MFNNPDLVYQIHTHLLYELKWLIYAATEFEKGNNPAYVALIDSACVHGRNLFEFVSKGGANNFTLTALRGGSAGRNDWQRFLNNRVSHSYGRENFRPTWPDGLDNTRQDKLVVMSNTVIDLMEINGRQIPAGDVRNAYDEVIQAAKAYLADPSQDNLESLDKLYDDSRDQTRPY